MPILKLITLTKSMTFEHSGKFFKNSLSVQYQLQLQYMILLQHITQWTSLSDLGNEFCLGITFSGEIKNSELSENLKISESELVARCVPRVDRYVNISGPIFVCKIH